jgi:prepilin-type N-terminal cleavage/methylation domain-containing protein
MRNESHHRGQSGFTLIEVMIAVVVLATGLLAMAALQAKLASNSADAKARSRVSALLMSVIDDQRASGYDSLASFVSTACTTSSPTALQTAICNAEGDAGISGLSLAQTVTFWCGLQGGGAFTQKAAPFVCPSSKYTDYKRIQLTAIWTDATGASRSLGAVNVTSSLGLSGSTTFLNNPLTKKSITPMVHQPNPGLTDGVIPIAVGTNSLGNDIDTASTNPRPTVGVTLPSTTFNTLTYSQGALDTSITRTIQKRVETTVAECGCQYSSANPFTVKVQGSDVVDPFLGTNKFRPTYWNGLRYVAPTSEAFVAPYSGQLPDLKGSQSDVCSIVCRDHHDTSSDVVKYDSVTNDFNRYTLSVTTTGNGNNKTTQVALALDSDGKPIPASASNGVKYLDAARLIRVDGLWRVATDMHAEHVGLLATKTAADGYATSPSPEDAAETKYGGKDGFVVDYIGKRLNQLLFGGTAPDANALYETHNLNIPALIQTDTSGKFRYLHARGLYLDTLEQPLINKLTNVKDNSCTTYPDCLLPYLPFNTINASQLASWSSLSSSTATKGRIDVKNSTTSNTAVLCDTSANTLVRGCVSGKSVDDASSNPYDQAIATMGLSNSAIATSAPISPYDRANKLSDAQNFSVTTGTATSSEFFAQVSGGGYSLPNSTTGLFWTDDLSTTNEPTLRWVLGTASDFCSGNISSVDANPNPYDCVTTVALNVPFDVVLGNYNQIVQQQATYTTPSGTTGTANQPVLVCYKVTAASVVAYPGGTPVGSYSVDFATIANPGLVNETTTLKISGAPTPMVKSTRQMNVTLEAYATKAGAETLDTVTGVPTYATPTSCAP